MQNLFFDLIRVALGQQECLSLTPSPEEWKELYRMAKKQSLLGICFAGVQRLQNQQQCPPEEVYDRWMGMSATIQMRNKVVDRQCVELQRRLAEDGYRSCVLKGQGVGKLYQIRVESLEDREERLKLRAESGELREGSSELRDLSLLRQSGDIDVWVDATKEEVLNYVMKRTPNDVFDQKHIHYNCYKDTDVEVHWLPFLWENPWHNKILLDYTEKERERQFSNTNGSLCYPTLSFQLVHQLLHVYRHYVYEGVGLRQVMDLYFAQMACKEEDYQAALTLFQRLHLMKYVAATQRVMQSVFHMPADKLLCSPDEKEGKKLLQEIMIGGNFGQHDERNHVEGETFLQRFLRRWARRFRMFRFDPLGTLVMPFTRIKLEIWMRKVRRKYGLTA